MKCRIIIQMRPGIVMLLQCIKKQFPVQRKNRQHVCHRHMNIFPTICITTTS
ncbi:hypothetical protein ROD_p1101 (plasmid) [Citrobacter rodentium ICC168]|uniref:Uncharacterized protein n=1 Tax=Citrobacter rodentium (strain ICC168) TaxID=637910 RepID=D2TV86_CITRI|nr:hypothetical protein ROD_p1101 [Citrobacter rodentium ICC168]